MTAARKPENREVANARLKAWREKKRLENPRKSRKPVPSNRGKRGPDKAPRRTPVAFDPDNLNVPGFFDAPAPNLAVVRDRVRHSDAIMEAVPSELGRLLHKYFDFDWMPFHIEGLTGMFAGGKRVLNWPTDMAKLVADSVPVATPMGWKLHGDLGMGDSVYGPDGQPTLVVGVNPPDTANMRVFFSDGSSILCHPRHEWTVWHRGEERHVTYEAQHLAKLKLVSPSGRYDRPHYQLDRAQPLAFDHSSVLPVDPYTLGVWLGDGRSTAADVCGSAKDMDHIVARIPYPKGWSTVHATTGVVYQGFGDLRHRLRVAGVLDNKHIPMAYLRSSEDQRRALLAGLIDTDGHVTPYRSKVIFSGINERLVRDVAALARTLGYRATVHEIAGTDADRMIAKQLVHGRRPMWGTQWVPDDGQPQGTLARKTGTRISPRRRVGIVGIESASPEEGHCIQVARPDGLYLVGETLLPTHNSYMTQHFFPILSLMENPDESHILCGANAADAKRRVQMIQRTLEDNHALTSDYPWIKKPSIDVKQKWSTTELTVAGRHSNRPDPSVFATSTSANETKGRRGKLLLDDAEGEDHRFSQLKRERLYDWVKLVALRTYEDKHESRRPLSLACGTPMDVDSIYFRLTREGWITDRRPIYTDPPPWEETDPALHMDTLLWPDKFDKVREQWRSMNLAQFSINYLMDPKAGNQTRLTLEEIENLTAAAGAADQAPVTYVSLDPAGGGGGSRVDYAGIAVVRISWPSAEKMPAVEVLEAYKVDFPQGYVEHVELAADLALKYDCRIIYESNAQQGGVYRRAFRHHRPDVLTRLVSFHTTADAKFDEQMGLTMIQRLVRQSRLRVPQGQLESEGMQALMKEVRDLGSQSRGHHDHISAAIWFAIRHVYVRIQAINGPQAVSLWSQSAPDPRRDLVDREPSFAGRPAAAVNGWNQSVGIRPYRRFAGRGQ